MKEIHEFVISSKRDEKYQENKAEFCEKVIKLLWREKNMMSLSKKYNFL